MWISSIAGIVIVGLVVQFLLDPLSRLQNMSENAEARLGLPLARARWQAQNITNYSFELGTGFGGICMPSARIEVKQGKVVQVYPKDIWQSGRISKTPLPRSKWASSHYADVFLCDYANFTMPQIFDEVERSLRHASKISFDAKYGFVSGVRWGSPGGRGLLDPKISDCCTSLGIQNFQLLEE